MKIRSTGINLLTLFAFIVGLNACGVHQNFNGSRKNSLSFVRAERNNSVQEKKSMHEPMHREKEESISTVIHRDLDPFQLKNENTETRRSDTQSEFVANHVITTSVDDAQSVERRNTVNDERVHQQDKSLKRSNYVKARSDEPKHSSSAILGFSLAVLATLLLVVFFLMLANQSIGSIAGLLPILILFLYIAAFVLSAVGVKNGKNNLDRTLARIGVLLVLIPAIIMLIALFTAD